MSPAFLNSSRSNILLFTLLKPGSATFVILVILALAVFPLDALEEKRGFYKNR